MSDDEEVDGVQVVLGALGEGERLAHEAAHALAQRAKPAFHVAGFSLPLGAAAMGARRKGGAVGSPKIAAGGATAVVLGQGDPQVAGTLLAAVAQAPGHDLAGTPAKRHPQPEGLRLAAHQAPEFIQLQHVVLLAGQQRISEVRQVLRFFPSPAMTLS